MDYEYKKMVRDIDISGLRMLKQKKSNDLQGFKIKYGIRDDSDIWKLDYPYEDRKELFKEYKSLQQQWKIIDEEISERVDKYDDGTWIVKFEPNKEFYPEISISNPLLDSNDYIGSYSEDYYYGSDNVKSYGHEKDRDLESD